MKNWQTITLILGGSLLAFIGFIATSAALFVSAIPSQPTVAAQPVVKDRPLLDMVNELRLEKGVAPLTHTPELDKSAQEKADNLASNHYFGHVSPQGVRGIDIIPKYLTQAKKGSENLAICGDNDNNRGAFKLWLNSPAHYQGMIDPTVTLYGEGKAWDSEKHCTVYVNHFAAV
jgi:uncharacterized protein YkwD